MTTANALFSLCEKTNMKACLSIETLKNKQNTPGLNFFIQDVYQSIMAFQDLIVTFKLEMTTSKRAVILNTIAQELSLFIQGFCATIPLKCPDLSHEFKQILQELMNLSKGTHIT